MDQYDAGNNIVPVSVIVPVYNFVDSDDWCESNMLEVLYNKANIENIDMVFCNFYADRPKKYPNVNIIKGLGNEDIIALMFRTLKPFVWNKLVRRDIYLQCSFPTASYAEDFYIIIQAISCAKNVGYVEDFLYHYCYNPSSVCEDPNNFEQQRLDLHTNTRNIVNFLKTRYGDKANQFKSAHNECLNHHMKKYNDKTFADYDL
ncbi:hypothetical protein FACS1894163_10660 [Spirochaetia bacterium]|nr:hypothetical protein FACS1894163_10660 [Spirochaetia bacterium]